MATNLIADQVATLDIQLYLGNEFIVPFLLDHDLPIPQSVSCVAYSQQGGSPLNAMLQPMATISGRSINVLFPASTIYPKQGYYELKFDGRKVIAGSLFGLRKTTDQPIDRQSVLISPADLTPITLSVATDFPKLGEVRYLGENFERWTGSEWATIPIGPPIATGFPFVFPLILQ